MTEKPEDERIEPEHEGELPPAPPDAETYVAPDAAVIRGTPGEAGAERAKRPPEPGEPFPGGGDMKDPDVERELEDL